MDFQQDLSSSPPSQSVAEQISSGVQDTGDSNGHVGSSWRHLPTIVGSETDRLITTIGHADPSATKSTDSTSSGADATSTATKLSGQQRRILGSLSAGGLLAGCCIAVMIPFFPHEVQRRGLPQTYSGAVFSCYALVQLLTFPVLGRLAPFVGVTRLYNIGLAVAGSATVTFGMLPYIANSMEFIAACLTCRALEAVGTAAMETATRTIIINQFPNNPNTAMGVAETLTGVGLSLGPALGGGLYEVGGYGAPFYTLGCTMLIIAGINRWLMPAVEDAAAVAGAARQESSCAKFLRFFSAGENWLCCSVVLVVAMYFTSLDPNIEPYVRRTLGITPAQLALFFLVSSSCYTVSGLAWGRISDRVSNTYVLTAPCLLVCAVGILLMPPSPLLVGLKPSWWLLGLGMVIREVAIGGAYIPIMSRMVRVCVAHGMENNLSTQAFVSAVFGAVFSVGNVLGPTLGGYITDIYSFPMAATVLAAIGSLVAAMCAVGAVVTARRRS